MAWNVKWHEMSNDMKCQVTHDTWHMIYILLNISNLYADADARSMTPSKNTRSYTLRSVPSPPGRSFFSLLTSSTFFWQSWFLGTDMWFFFASPIIVYPLWLSKFGRSNFHINLQHHRMWRFVHFWCFLLLLLHISQTLPEAQRTQGIESITWDGAIFISCKIITCISSNFDHQMAPLALFTNFLTRLSHLH